jgi:FAD dependent oxidoreductase TIGR03364
VLYSPHEMRVESRTAIGQLTRWLAEAMGVTFRFSEAVLEVATPRVRTARATLFAERVAVCTNTDLNGLFAERLTPHRLRLCQLHMLRVRPEAGLKLPGSVMMDLSLVRYHGYSQLPAAAALRAQLDAEEGESLAHGIHLIVVQSADGSLVVGDSHHYGPVLEPFADQRVDELILQHLRSTLRLKEAAVTERWVGTYPSSASTDCLIDQPDAATRLVLVTSGTGASTAFGIAEEVFNQW